MKFVDLDLQYAQIEPAITQAMAQVMQHKQFIMGPEINALENSLSRYCDAKHVITAASGTDALLMSLMAYGVGPNDGVIVPSFTFIASAEMIALLGATVVFTEVNEDSYNLCPQQLEETIKKAQAAGIVLKGIIPVDLFGLPVDMDKIQVIADQHNLFVLCDIAQSFGAKYKQKKTGSMGDICATSFFPAKPLGCYGDGGAVFTNSDGLAGIVESIRFHGKGISQYENVRVGITGRMDTLQAAVLQCKLDIFDKELKMRQAIADNYNDQLADHVKTPVIPSHCQSSWSVYTIQSEKRDHIRARLQQENVPCATYYPSPLHRQPTFSNAFGAGQDMPVSDQLSKQVLSLPIHPYLTEQQQQKVINTIRSVLV